MKEILQNPVYQALLTGDRHLNISNGNVKYFDEEVSPFAGFDENNTNGFAELNDILSPGRKILYAIQTEIDQPAGWQFTHKIKGLQFVYKGGKELKKEFTGIIPLDSVHAEEMVQLAKLTKPGPFAKRTIEFGSYYGVFENTKLVAMTGQRLHVGNYTEISAVCTHPDYLGKGYAFKLMQHQLDIILQNDQQPFLHVREDNQRAIALYERLGFRISRPMYFYFMKRE